MRITHRRGVLGLGVLLVVVGCGGAPASSSPAAVPSGPVAGSAEPTATLEALTLAG